MGTQKRERQKANKLQRQQEEARAERVGTAKRTALRWGVGIVAAIGAIVLIAWIGGAFSSGDDADETIVTLPAVVTAAPTPDEPAPPKPDVEIPDELPDELTVTELVAGTGEGAQNGDTVTVHYVGVRSEDGVEFDNSYDRGTPFPVVLGTGSVIAGWDQGLVDVQAGGRYQLDIPADLAYGDADRGTIRPGDALTFVVDVVSITPASDS